VSNDPRDRFEDALELGTRLLNDWHGLNKRMAATIADLAAAAYDTEPADTVVWCWEHEQSVTACAKAEWYCAGEPTARHTDPTGNAGVSTQAYEDGGQFIHHARKAAHHVEQMAVIWGRYKPDDPQLTLDVEQENTKPDGCEFCARVDRWSPSHTTNPTDVGGILDTPRRCCSPHYDFIRTRERTPTEAEDKHYVTKGKWPKIKQLDRLVNGLRTGTLV
jgi:hypothetical protein